MLTGSSRSRAARPREAGLELIGKAIASATFVDGAGLHRSATRVRLGFDGDQRTVVRGPYRGGNELLAGCAMITATSIDHAIELATQLARAAARGLPVHAA